MIGHWKKIKGKDLDEYLDTHFEKAWHAYDSNNAEFIDVRNAYYWVRQLAGEDYYSA